jgi:hypothetical protein
MTVSYTLRPDRRNVIRANGERWTPLCTLWVLVAITLRQLTFMVARGVKDPNVDMSLGLLTDDIELVRSALERDADQLLQIVRCSRRMLICSLNSIFGEDDVNKGRPRPFL